MLSVSTVATRHSADITDMRAPGGGRTDSHLVGSSGPHAETTEEPDSRDQHNGP